MLSLLSAYIFWKAYTSEDRNRWDLYVIAASLSLYTHYYSGFIILAELLFLAGGKQFKKAIKLGLFLGFIFLPQFPTLWVQYHHHISKQLPVMSFSQLSIFFSNIIGLENVFLSERLSIIFGLLIFVVMAFGLLKLRKEKPSAILYLLLLLFVPTLIPFLISRFSSNHVFIYRYVIFFVPYFFLLFITAIKALLKDFYSAILLLFLLLNLGLWTLFISGSAYQRQNWRGASSLLRQSLKPNDMIFVEQTMAMPCLDYYLPDFFTMDWKKTFFADVGEEGMSITTRPINNMNTTWLGLEGEASLGVLVKLVPKSNHPWLVLCQSSLVDPHQRVLDWFMHHGRLIKSYQFRSFRPTNEIFIFSFAKDEKNKEKQKPVGHLKR